MYYFFNTRDGSALDAQQSRRAQAAQARVRKAGHSSDRLGVSTDLA